MLHGFLLFMDKPRTAAEQNLLDTVIARHRTLDIETFASELSIFTKLSDFSVC